jgi:phosphonate transport system substrate-binding protein
MKRPAATLLVCALLTAVIAVGASAAPAVQAPACPGDGTVRLGLVPGEDTETMMAVYQPIADEFGRRIGCPVQLSITNSYTAAIEAMRAKRLEISGFGPLSYVLAHRVAGAEAIAVQGHDDGTPVTYEATIVAPKTSGITRLQQVAGRSFAYSDPASTSGHLMPAYGLRKAGIDPETGVRAYFAGSHTATYEALHNRKVDAGELNTSLIRIMTARGEYDANEFVTLWRSGPIPGSPWAIRGDLPPAFKARVRQALYSMDLRAITHASAVLAGSRYVPAKDSTYDGIRDMLTTLHVDLNKINE